MRQKSNHAVVQSFNPEEEAHVPLPSLSGEIGESWLVVGIDKWWNLGSKGEEEEENSIKTDNLMETGTISNSDDDLFKHFVGICLDFQITVSSR